MLEGVRRVQPARFVAVALSLLFVACGAGPQTGASVSAPPPARPGVTLAVSSTVEDSGLLDVLLPYFQQTTGYRVTPVSLNSEQALSMLNEGKVDAALVSAPIAGTTNELVDRRLIMQGDYVIAGPSTDPAHLAGKGALDALKTVAATGTTWVSRRDGSDTNRAELALWQEALGRDAQHEGWYVSTHNGMDVTLKEANRRRAYTFTDRATLLSLRGSLDLKVIVERDPLLATNYEIVRASPAGHLQLNDTGTEALADFLVSPAARQIIGSYGVERFGQPVFSVVSQAGDAPGTP